MEYTYCFAHTTSDLLQHKYQLINYKAYMSSTIQMNDLEYVMLFLFLFFVFDKARLVVKQAKSMDRNKKSTCRSRLSLQNKQSMK